MNWQTFYLICFVVGVALSVLSLAGGMGRFGVHMHLPHAHLGHLPHGAGMHGAAVRGAGHSTVPWWNAFSVMIFLCWFGAAGYLLTRYGALMAGVVLLLAAACGAAGGAIIFWFLVKVLLPHERELTADETEVVGAVGRVSAPIRPGGTGEMIYEQLGAVRSVPARAEDGEPIEKQAEVFVVRFEKGVAFVRRFEEGLRD
jgi:hypothetical protein